MVGLEYLIIIFSDNCGCGYNNVVVVVFVGLILMRRESGDQQPLYERLFMYSPHHVT